MLQEPMTIFTDYLLGAVSITLGAILIRRGSRGGKAASIWGCALALSGLGALTGGTWHGVRSLASPLLLTVLWKVTLAMIGFAASCLMTAISAAALRSPLRTAVELWAAVQLATYLVMISRSDDFVWAVAQYGTAMAVVAAVTLWRFKDLRPAAPWILGGVALSAAAAAVQQARPEIHPLFNHNDLYHLIQLAATVVLYRGGAALPSGTAAAEGRSLPGSEAQ